LNTVQKFTDSPRKTTACRFTVLAILFFAALSLTACGGKGKDKPEEEEEALSRTEFTERIENFFEHEPLKAGKASQFLIHLTDLKDGSPVEKAEVTLTIRTQGGAEVERIKARVGKVTGIYVADVKVSNPGDYDIEFHVKNEKLDERLPLKDFQVE
jgi:hypothetical protein